MYYEFQVIPLGDDVSTWRDQQTQYLQEPNISTFLLTYTHRSPTHPTFPLLPQGNHLELTLPGAPTYEPPPEPPPLIEYTRPSDSEVHPLIETSTCGSPPPPNDPTPLLDLGRGRGAWDRGQQVAGVGGGVG